MIVRRTCVVLALLCAADLAEAGCGWYLLVPPQGRYDEKAPFLQGIKILMDSPLSKWNHQGSYESAEVCETVKASQVRMEHSVYDKSKDHYMRLLGAKEDPKALSVQRYLTERNSANVDALIAARCVTSDDPRLR